MSIELRDLMNDLVADQPDHGIDLDERIRQGRRRVRVRNLATASLATVVTAGVIGAGFAFRPAPAADGFAGLTASPTPGPFRIQSGRVCVVGSHPGPASERCSDTPIALGTQAAHSTARSRALAAQLDSLVPEHAGVQGFSRYDDQRLGVHDKPVPLLEAGYKVGVSGTYARSSSLYALRVQVATGGSHADQPFCMVMYLPKPQCKGQPRTLPDGSRATVHSHHVAGKTRYAVTVVRKDGTEILIESGITLNDDAQTAVDVPVLGPERLLEIAQHLTVKP